jgi:hypothetical protein
MKGFAQLMLAGICSEENTKGWLFLDDVGERLHRLCQEMSQVSSLQ